MRYAILSDVHANIEALGAVLHAIDRERVDGVLGLGDLVGYHADPGACIAAIRRLGATCVAGNHDRAAAGVDGVERFTEAGRRAILWTRRALSDDERGFLAGLPLTEVVGGRFLLFHAALHPSPNVELHLGTDARVARTFEALGRGPWGARIALFGHTHRPVVHELWRGELRALPPREVFFRPDALYLVNPGSVGQPRDGDPRASFAILDADEGSVRFHRVAFDRGACLDKAARAGLLYEASAIERGVRSFSDWVETGVSAVKRRLA